MARTSKLSQPALALAVGALLLVGFISAAAGQGQSGKIPVTTSSEEARENYLAGQERLENIEIPDARAHFEEAVAKDPAFALAHLGLAFTQTSPDAFLAQVEKARMLADTVSKGERLWILAVEANAQGDGEKASALFEQLVAAYPEDERARFLLGNSYFGLQNFAQAIEEYRKSVDLNPRYAAPYNQLGYALRFSGNYSDAEEAFKKYIELIPDNPNPYDSYAELLLTMGKYDESIETYRKVLSVDPSFITSYMGIAANLNFKGKHTEAREQLQEMLDKAQNDGQRRGAHFATVVSYVDEGKLDKAVEELRKMYAIAERNGNTIQMAQDLNGMAYLLLEAGAIDQARDLYEQSARMREEADIPESAKAQARRDHFANAARVAPKKKDMSAAKASTGSFRELAENANNPAQVRLYHELSGMISLEEKEYEKALEELQQANQLNPYNLYRMALAYEGKGETEKAKELCKQVEGLNQFNSVNYGLARHKAEKMLASM
jgi:tetratricopeptide (TPR) repeat protein